MLVSSQEVGSYDNVDSVNDGKKSLNVLFIPFEHFGRYHAGFGVFLTCCFLFGLFGVVVHTIKLLRLLLLAPILVDHHC